MVFLVTSTELSNGSGLALGSRIWVVVQAPGRTRFNYPDLDDPIWFIGG